MGKILTETEQNLAKIYAKNAILGKFRQLFWSNLCLSKPV